VGFVLAWTGLSGCSTARHTPAASAGVAILPEHYTQSIAAIGSPGAKRTFQIGHGCVVSTGECALEWRLLPAGRATTVSPVYFERDGVPIAHWSVADGERRVDFEAAAAPRPALGDTSLVLSVRAIAGWRGAASGEVTLEARVRATPDGPHCVPWDVPDDTVFTEWWRGHEAVRNGLVVAELDQAIALPAGGPTLQQPGTTSGAGPGTLVARWSARLRPGERRQWDFVVPLYPVATGRETELSKTSHAQVVAAARRYWRARLAAAAVFDTPDTLVNLAWRAALVTLIACQERSAGHWVPIGNPFQYRDVWLRDGARVVRGLAVAGLGDLARDDARTLARFQLPTGALISQRGQLDGTGQAIWAFAEAAALPPSPDFAREMLPSAERAYRWIRRQRGYSISMRLPWAGLLPYADPHDGELVRAQLVGNDAWAIAGCRAFAALARATANEPLAREADSTYQTYRSAFTAALARTRSADIPPSWQGAGRDWGNAAVGYPTRVLDASDPRLARLASRMRASAAGTGLVSYGPADSLHTYLGADLAQWSLLVERADEARGWLAGVLAHSSSTLGQAEVLSRAGGFGDNLPPHATAAATLVDLLRNMIVSDGRDTLAIALGAPLAWWGGTRLGRAPTRFGFTDVSLGRPARDVLRVRLEPLPVAVRVRVPDGARAIAALSAGARVVDGRWVEAPRATREITFRIAEEPRQ
jgi:hypothetical protein